MIKSQGCIVCCIHASGEGGRGQQDLRIRSALESPPLRICNNFAAMWHGCLLSYQLLRHGYVVQTTCLCPWMTSYSKCFVTHERWVTPPMNIRCVFLITCRIGKLAKIYWAVLSASAHSSPMTTLRCMPEDSVAKTLSCRAVLRVFAQGDVNLNTRTIFVEDTVNEGKAKATTNGTCPLRLLRSRRLAILSGSWLKHVYMNFMAIKTKPLQFVCYCFCFCFEFACKLLYCVYFLTSLAMTSSNLNTLVGKGFQNRGVTAYNA